MTDAKASDACVDGVALLEFSGNGHHRDATVASPAPTDRCRPGPQAAGAV